MEIVNTKLKLQKSKQKKEMIIIRGQGKKKENEIEHVNIIIQTLSICVFVGLFNFQKAKREPRMFIRKIYV